MGTTITWEILAYFMALIGVKEFSDLGALTSDQLKLSDPKLLKTEDWNISMSKEPVENTGGVDVGLNVNNLEYDSETNTYKATKTGSIFAISAPSAVKAILNALGVNVLSTPQVNQKIADALNTAFSIGVTATTMNQYTVPVLIKNGITYLSYTFIKKLSDALYSNGLFSSGGVAYNIPDTGTYPNSSLSYSFTYTVDDIYDMLVDYFDYLVTEGKLEQSRATILESRFKTAITPLVNILNANKSYAPYQCVRMAIVSGNQIAVGLDYWEPDSSGTFSVTKVSNDLAHTNISTSGSLAIRSDYTHNWINTSMGCIWDLGYSITSNELHTSNIYGSFAPAVEGIDLQIGATIPATNDIDLDTTYPDWVTHAIDIGWYDNVVDTIRRGRALPIDVSGIRDNLGAWDETQPWAQAGATDIADTAVTDVISIGATDVIPLVVDIDDVVVTPADIPDVIPQPTPPVVIPGGTSSAGLATIYNPTEAQVNALKGDLWSQNIITTLQSIFLNNPMDAIISLNKVFCTPHTNGTATIKLGYIQTSVTGVKTVDDQYTTIDCGTVNVPEIYGNTTDYEPYTNVSVFLPFIGIQNLSAKDVVGGKLQIIYRVDVTTGTCIAQLFVTKQGAKQMLYSFEGNCAVEIPLSGSNANRAIIGLASIAASTVAPGAGLALAGGAMNLVNGVNLQRSGGFQSNAGAMNNKKPYLIINRVLPYEASGYNQIYGYPSNNRVLLSSVTGYTRVKDVHVEGISCTDYEKNLIEEQLKAGILL